MKSYILNIDGSGYDNPTDVIRTNINKINNVDVESVRLKYGNMAAMAVTELKSTTNLDKSLSKISSNTGITNALSAILR